VLTVNTLLIGLTISMYSFVQAGTPLYVIVAISLCLGFFNSLQFSSMNSIAYADVEGPIPAWPAPSPAPCSSCR
jgi:hypothetical protein